MEHFLYISTVIFQPLYNNKYVLLGYVLMMIERFFLFFKVDISILLFYFLGEIFL